MQVRISRSSAGGDVGVIASSGGGSRSRIEAIRLAWVLPSNALRPLAISYSKAPKAKMSVRVSASTPSSCSGAMYWNVPTIDPSVVSGLVAVGGAVRSEGVAGAIDLARPKSSSLAPIGVSMMLPGLRSRWIRFCRCALSSASAIWIP